ncbi:MAG: hypothetical protein AAB434_06045 [Planctomycetota bacterium]
MRRSDRGVANVLVIMLVAAGIVAMVLGYLAQAEANQVAQEIDRLAARSKQEEARKKAAYDQLNDLIAKAGWPRTPFNAENDFDTVFDELQKHRIMHLEKRKDRLGLTQLPDSATTIADLFQGDKAGRNGSTTLERIVAISESYVGVLEGTLRQAEYQLATVQASAKSAQDRMNAILEMKSKEIEVLQKGDEATKREGVEQLTKRHQDISDSYSQAQTRKEQQRDAVKDQYKTKEAEMTKDVNRLMGEISRTIQQLEEIQKKEAVVQDITRPQGAVVNPQADGRTCYINLGEAAGLFLGQKFRVFHKGFAGQNVWKGEIEVKRVMADTSLCSVTAMFQRNEPIIEGDLIYNPLYNGGTPRTVVLLGEFEGVGISKDEFVRRVRMHGGQVVEKIDWNTDFVVLGANVDTGSAAYKEGALIGVPFVPVQQVLQYLGD